MTDNQQARDFSQDFFPKPEAKFVGGLMSSFILLSRGTVTGYSPSGFVFFTFFLLRMDYRPCQPISIVLL
jgi:hypothetical protein